MNTVDFELHVQEPFFSHLRSGEKTIEGRCALGDYNKIEAGASILFNKCLVLQVQDVHHYASFREMLEAEPLSKVLPGIKSTEEGVQVYRNFYSEEKERSNGVLAICVTKPVSQPYLSMASIISVSKNHILLPKPNIFFFHGVFHIITSYLAWQTCFNL
nr:Zinc finger protein like [Ipomoea batatas]